MMRLLAFFVAATALQQTTNVQKRSPYLRIRGCSCLLPPGFFLLCCPLRLTSGGLLKCCTNTGRWQVLLCLRVGHLMVRLNVGWNCLEAESACILGQLCSCCMHALLQHVTLLCIAGQSPLQRRWIVHWLVDGLVMMVRPICTCRVSIK